MGIGTETLAKSWRVWLLAGCLVVAILGIFFIGLAFGIEFKGGTSFQIKLAKPATGAEQQEQIRSIIEQRLNFTGLRDVKVTVVGNDLILADIAETDPSQVEQLESLILRQGKFEATLDGNLLFSGSDFQVIKDPGRGYGLRSRSEGDAQWVLPFILKPEAAQRFTQLSFHQCEAVGVGQGGQRDYDCKNTFFFIDRPQESVLVFLQTGFSEDEALMKGGNQDSDIPANAKLSELLLNAAVPYVVLDANSDQNNSSAWQELGALVATHPTAIIPENLPKPVQDALQGKGFTLKPVKVPQGLPFSWQATGARSIISLTPGVANLDPYVVNESDAKVFSELVIQGSASTEQDAQSRLNSLTVLLQSGSLPIAVDSIGKETISPLLGKEFLKNVLYMGLASVLAVLLVIFVRYRVPRLVVPIAATVIFEVLLILGFAAFTKWNLDLASIAGLIAAIGTGVDQQVIITDELLKGRKDETASLNTRSKRALFIVVAAASVSVATMFPIILFGFGLGKLVGFATVTIVGVLVGILITRPAFSEFAKVVIASGHHESE